MRTFCRIVAPLSMIAVGAAVAPKVAEAQEASAPQAVVAAPVQLGHRHQTGLSLLPGIGYQVIVPYQEHKDCGDSSGHASKRVCTNSVPLFLDLQLSYGVTARLDVVADLRFGVVSVPVVNTHQFALAPGIRIWLDPELEVKLFTTFQVVYDSTDYHDTVPTDDFGIRNANGLMVDVMRNVGFFGQFGETIGLRRWFRIALDIGAGVQVRFP